MEAPEQPREKLSDWIEKRGKAPTLEDLRYYETRAESAEARVQELEKALRQIQDFAWANHGSSISPRENPTTAAMRNIAHAALAAAREAER